MPGSNDKPIRPHGGYRGLEAYRLAEIVFDATVRFTELYLDKRSRTVDQMVQAARSGKQNIAEGSMASGTSQKTEIKLVGVARASLEELLLDYEDFLRINAFEKWDKSSDKAMFIRRLAYCKDKSYETYRTYVENKGSQNAANTMVCIINQANFLLDRLKRSLEKEFVESGGFAERLYRSRATARTRD